MAPEYCKSKGSGISAVVSRLIANQGVELLQLSSQSSSATSFTVEYDRLNRIFGSTFLGKIAQIPLLLGFEYSCATANISPLVTPHPKKGRKGTKRSTIVVDNNETSALRCALIILVVLQFLYQLFPRTALFQKLSPYFPLYCSYSCSEREDNGPEGKGASPPNSPPPRAILPAITSTCNTSEAHLLPSYHTLLLINANTDTDLLIV